MKENNNNCIDGLKKTRKYKKITKKNSNIIEFPIEMVKNTKSNLSKKNNNKNEIYDSSINIPEDPLVVQFKNDLREDFIFANTITKIKPFISENWIKTITSY